MFIFISILILLSALPPLDDHLSSSGAFSFWEITVMKNQSYMIKYQKQCQSEYWILIQTLSGFAEFNWDPLPRPRLTPFGKYQIIYVTMILLWHLKVYWPSKLSVSVSAPDPGNRRNLTLKKWFMMFCTEHTFIVFTKDCMRA